MTKPVAIIQFPGSNTERETFLACERNGLATKAFLWNEPPGKLSNFSGFVDMPLSSFTFIEICSIRG